MKLPQLTQIHIDQLSSTRYESSDINELIQALQVSADDRTKIELTTAALLADNRQPTSARLIHFASVKLLTPDLYQKPLIPYGKLREYMEVNSSKNANIFKIDTLFYYLLFPEYTDLIANHGDPELPAAILTSGIGEMNIYTVLVNFVMLKLLYPQGEMPPSILINLSDHLKQALAKEFTSTNYVANVLWLCSLSRLVSQDIISIGEVTNMCPEFIPELITYLEKARSSNELHSLAWYLLEGLILVSPQIGIVDGEIKIAPLPTLEAAGSELPININF